MTDVVRAGIEQSLDLFVSAIERTSNLDILGYEIDDEGSDILVIENSNIDCGIEGHQCTVEVSEIFAKITDCKGAQEFVDVINADRSPLVCMGVTRIVGYYSRTANWNKSKIGELRDRQAGQYGTGKHHTEHKDETLQAVNSLS